MKNFYFFRPNIEIMKSTLQKIEKTNELQYFDIYENACRILRISEDNIIISPKKIKEFVEVVYKAEEELIKSNGFH
jgi:hypothetical protein